MWLWVQNNVGCYKFHEIKCIFSLRYHGINHTSSVYSFVIKVVYIVLECIFICVCLRFCVVDFLNCFEANSPCNELLALHFEMVFGMSQSLALVWQPTRIRPCEG